MTPDFSKLFPSLFPSEDGQEALKRLSEIRVGESQIEALGRIAALTGGTKAEALAKAISLYLAVCACYSEGGKVEKVGPDGARQVLKNPVRPA